MVGDVYLELGKLLTSFQPVVAAALGLVILRFILWALGRGLAATV